MVNIIVQGACGRMGQALARLISPREDCRVVAGVDVAASQPLGFPVYSRLGEVMERADVLIDFSLPEASMDSLRVAVKTGLACVVCTTGFSEKQRLEIEQISHNIPLFFSGNMSIGINLLQALVAKARSVLTGFDVEIVEKHHRNKLDAPSGTALMLADAVNAATGGEAEYCFGRHQRRQVRPDNEIGISSVRGGSIVGEHEVIFAGPDEMISLSHTAYSRDIFANGAIAAALFLAGQKPGLYDMSHLIAKG